MCAFDHLFIAGLTVGDPVLRTRLPLSAELGPGTERGGKVKRGKAKKGVVLMKECKEEKLMREGNDDDGGV